MWYGQRAAQAAAGGVAVTWTVWLEAETGATREEKN